MIRLFYFKLPYFLKFLLYKIGIFKNLFKKIKNLHFKVHHKNYDKLLVLNDLIKISPKKGVIVECGVGIGYSLLMIYKLSKRKIYAFDSFEGFPSKQSKHDHKKISEIIKTQKWNYKFMSVDLVKENLINNNVKVHEIEKNIVFKKGFYPDSFEGFNEEVSFLHLDVDLYQSYKDCLEFFFPKLINGGIITFDEYYDSTTYVETHEKGLSLQKKRNFDWRGSTAAIDEFVKKNNLKLLEHSTGFKYIIK